MEKINEAIKYYTYKREGLLNFINSKNDLTVEEIIENAEELSILEYTNILFSILEDPNFKTPKEFENYKIFFTDNLDTTFITMNSAAKCIFIDSDDVVDSYELSYSDENLVGYDFTKNEERFFKQFFRTDSESQKIEEINAKLEYQKYMDDYEDLDLVTERCLSVFSTN
jgi:hypothetical protein